MNKQEILNKIKEMLEEYDDTKLQLEDHNFKVDSTGWTKIVVGGVSYLENPEKDIWEMLECAGEQLFTWEAAMRETERAGKRMPTDEEFDVLFKEKKDMPNIVYAGYYDYTDKVFRNFGAGGYWWSSTPSSGDAWGRGLGSSYSTVGRLADYQGLGFSVRCIKQ
jgi:hypothetical protein